MRALVTALGVVLTLGIAVGGLPAESAAAQATLGCPATVQAGQQLGIEIAINVGTTPLGAYSIAVTYDPAVLTVASIAGGSTAQFSGNPTTNTPTPGTTNLSGFQSASLTSPTGIVSVAMITFDVAATASTTTDIGLTVKTLFDTDSVAIPPAPRRPPPPRPRRVPRQPLPRRPRPPPRRLSRQRPPPRPRRPRPPLPPRDPRPPRRRLPRPRFLRRRRSRPPPRPARPAPAH